MVENFKSLNKILVVVQFQQNRPCKQIFRNNLFKTTTPLKYVLVAVALPQPQQKKQFQDSLPHLKTWFKGRLSQRNRHRKSIYQRGCHRASTIENTISRTDVVNQPPLKIYFEECFRGFTNETISGNVFPWTVKCSTQFKVHIFTIDGIAVVL